jgi:hypothetical protein
MKRWNPGVFAMGIVAIAGMRLSGGVQLAAAEHDPEGALQKARERLIALEANRELLKGASEVKSSIERDEKQRLKSGSFVFARNATSPGKEAAKAKDASKPFFFVSVEVWSGRTPSPPGGLHEFEWKGQTYQMWVRVYGSDADLVKAVQKAIDEPLLMLRK